MVEKHWSGLTVFRQTDGTDGDGGVDGVSEAQ